MRSISGSNIRSIFNNFGVQVIPGHSSATTLKRKVFHKVPEGEEWKIALLHSVLKVKQGDWVLDFDEEQDEDRDIKTDILGFVAAG